MAMQPWLWLLQVDWCLWLMMVGGLVLAILLLPRKWIGMAYGKGGIAEYSAKELDEKHGVQKPKRKRNRPTCSVIGCENKVRKSNFPCTSCNTDGPRSKAWYGVTLQGQQRNNKKSNDARAKRRVARNNNVRTMLTLLYALPWAALPGIGAHFQKLMDDGKKYGYRTAGDTKQALVSLMKIPLPNRKQKADIILLLRASAILHCSTCAVEDLVKVYDPHYGWMPGLKPTDPHHRAPGAQDEDAVWGSINLLNGLLRLARHHSVDVLLDEYYIYGFTCDYWHWVDWFHPPYLGSGSLHASMAIDSGTDLSQYVKCNHACAVGVPGSFYIKCWLTAKGNRAQRVIFYDGVTCPGSDGATANAADAAAGRGFLAEARSEPGW